MTDTAPARVWTFGRTSALVLAVLALIAGFALISNRAVAAFVSVAENGLPGHLSLAADPYPTTLNPGFMQMTPGDTEYWQISTHLADPSSPLTMQFKRDGDLVERPGTDGLQVQAQLCDEEWTNYPAAPVCTSGATNIFGPTPANSPVFGALVANSAPVPGDAPVYDLGTLTNASDKFVLVTLSIPEQEPNVQSDQSLMGLQASFGFGFTAMGEDGPSNLPNTGLDLTALIVIAAGVLGLGIVLASARRARLGFDEGSRS